MRICAVINCGNGTYTIEKWKQQDCAKHQTRKGLGSCDCPQPFVLFPFPTPRKNPEEKKKWEKLINRKDPKTGKNWESKSHDRVCSKHFVDGKPTVSHPAPTLHLGYSKPDVVTPKRAPPKNRAHVHPTKKPRPRLPSPPMTPMQKVDHDHKYKYQGQCDCRPLCDCKGCVVKQIKINSLEEKVRQLERKLISNKLTKKPNTCKTSVKKKKQLFGHENISTDNDVNHCTGIRSKAAFDAMYNHLAPHAKKMSYWKSGRQKTKPRKFKATPKKCGTRRKLDQKDEFLMVLMRFRLDLTVHFLAILFGILPSTCSEIVTTWVRFLARTLKPLIVWPNKPTIKNNLPQQFKKKCPRLRCIIDCTEIFIERPRSMDLQAETWSDYKKHNTIKLLVGITPNGHISFLSKVYGGRASDVYITRKSGFYSLLDPNDVIMADRGFQIQEDLMLHHAELEVPPGAQGNRQMTRAKVKKTKVVANLRIHVERAINRLKDFKILNNTMPINMVSVSDDIITVCAALTNLQPDLVN